MVVVLLVLGILAVIAFRSFSRSNSDAVNAARVDSTAHAMKDQENARNVVMVANSALAAGAAVPTSDPSSLIDALQAGITAQPANLTFKINLSDTEQAAAAALIKTAGGVIELDPGH